MPTPRTDAVRLRQDGVPCRASSATRRLSILPPIRDIKGPAASSPTPSSTGDREFEKTASVMKLVVDGYAGAGTISMGGFDYHTGDRSTGEGRDFRAGVCIGACLEYRGASWRAADDLCLQRWLPVEQWDDRQLHRWARQGRMDRRQSVDGVLVLPGLQPDRPAGRDAASRSASSVRVATWKPLRIRAPTPSTCWWRP